MSDGMSDGIMQVGLVEAEVHGPDAGSVSFTLFRGEATGGYALEVHHVGEELSTVWILSGEGLAKLAAMLGREALLI